MILPIYLYGQPVIRAIAQPVEKNHEGLKELIENMKETMYASDGIGIAAPQVGQSLRLIYIDVDILSDKFPELKDKRLVLINPEIEIDEDSQVVTSEEGCLSLPGQCGQVTRPNYVKARAFDENMHEYEIEGEGLLARCICHELDHLDGHMYVEKVEGEIHDVEIEEETEEEA